jgi:hypothetical protein
MAHKRFGGGRYPDLLTIGFDTRDTLLPEQETLPVIGVAFRTNNVAIATVEFAGKRRKNTDLEVAAVDEGV